MCSDIDWIWKSQKKNTNFQELDVEKLRNSNHLYFGKLII